jgi:hypothetical protein
MAFFAQTGPEGYGGMGGALGASLGEALTGMAQQRQQKQLQQQQAGVLSRVLSGDATPRS